MSNVFETPSVTLVEPARVVTPRVIMPTTESAPAPQLGFGELYDISRDLDSTVGAVAELMQREDERFDPAFEATPELLEQSGLPPDYWGELVDAPNEKVFHHRALRLQEEVQNEAKLAGAGAAGFAARLAANFFDEGAWALSLASEGALAPFMAAQKLSRLQRAARVAGLAGAQNAALEAVIASASETRDATDVVYAGLQGMALGGALGGLLGRHVPDEADVLLENAVTRAMRVLDEQALQQAGARSIGAAEASLIPDVATSFQSTQFNPVTAAAAHEGPKGGWERTLNFFRFDVTGKLLQSSNEYVRYAADRMAENALGFFDRVSGRGGTASELRERRMRLAEYQVYKVAEPAYKDWLKTTGRPAYQRWSSSARDEFYSAVGRQIRDPDPGAPASVRSAADAMRRMYEEQLQALKAAGVKGFDQVDPNDNYLTRQFNARKVADYNQRFGEKQMTELLAESLRRNMPDLDEALSVKIANAYWRKVVRMQLGDEFNTSNLLSQDNHEIILGMLNEGGVDEDAIEAVRQILVGLRASSASRDAGRIPRGKQRLALDESYRKRLTDQSSNKPADVSVQDLFEDNAEYLMRSYLNQTSGHIALAETFKDLRFENSLTGETVEGIKSKADWDAFVREIQYRNQFDPKANEMLAVAQKTRGQSDLEDLQFLYDMITGRPPEDMSSAAVQAMHLVRTWNFARLMGQVGFAQLAEIGNILSFGTLKNVMRFVPELGQIARGKGDPELLKELTAATALGTEMTRHVIGSRIELDDGVQAAVGRGAFETTRRFMDKARHGVALVSGMTPITAAMQKTSLMVMAQRIADMAGGAKGFRGKAVKDAKGNLIGYSRLLDLGIDEPMWQRIVGQIKKHSKVVDGTTKLKELGLVRWDDIEAKSALEMGMFRLGRRIVQENDVGVTRRWMHGSLAKTLFQFRSFAAQAHHKQLLWNLKHSDLTTYLAFAYSMTMGAAAYLAQNALNNPDKPPPTTKDIALAAFQRAGFSALLPLGMDTVWGDILRNDPLFSRQRSSGLASGFVHGMPAMDLAEKLYRTAKLPVQVPQEDYDFSADDFKAAFGLMPFSNIIGMRNINALISSELPANSEY